MELRQLAAFVAVAEERNFTRAAARLYVAQSGLSATIRSLERDLHADLFVRTTRRVDLTPAGAALLPEARRALAAAAGAVDAVNSVEGLQRGTLDIGIMQTSGLWDIARLLARFGSAYPGVTVRLRQTSSVELDRMLVEGDLDVIFTTLIDEQPEGIRSFPLLRSPLVLVTAPDHPVPGPSPVDLATAARGRVVGFPHGWGIRALADRGMRAAGLEPHVDLEINDTTTLLDLVESGLGVAVVPDVIARLRPSLTATVLAGQSLHWTVAAQTVAPRPVNPAARALWDMLVRDRPAMASEESSDQAPGTPS